MPEQLQEKRNLIYGTNLRQGIERGEMKPGTFLIIHLFEGTERGKPERHLGRLCETYRPIDKTRAEIGHIHSGYLDGNDEEGVILNFLPPTQTIIGDSRTIRSKIAYDAIHTYRVPKIR